MKNLRLLDVDSKCSSGNPTLFPDKLRWLCWYRYPFSSFPIKHMHQLVGLEMCNGFIKCLWKGKKILPSLRFVDLSHSLYLRKFPDVSKIPNMERLILSDCSSLEEVHQSLGFHKRLVYLDMSGCNQLKCLPSPIEMESLETLILSSCKSLERFPEVSPCMVKLSNIYLDNCIQIEELPSSIRYLSGLSFLNMTRCYNLKNIPNSICELKHLKSLHLHNCMNLQVLPADLGSMGNLEELLLGFSNTWNLGFVHNSISFRSFTSVCSLRKLDLSWRQIGDEEFPQNFHAFSALEELHLSGNSELTRLPAGISRLSCLKLLELNMCCRLQILHALPSGIQVLRARGCSSLEKIGDLSQEYEWLYKVWFLDSHKLLQDQENGRYIDKMLQQSFLKKCASVDHRLSIVVPGRKTPSWFKEQHGCNVALRLSSKLHTRVIGFAICGVFHGNWGHACPRIIFRIVNDKKDIPKSEVDTSETVDNCNLWVTYMPFHFFQQMYPHLLPQDWSRIEGNLVMTLMNTDGKKSIRCGAHVVYKDDLPQLKPIGSISDYGILVQVKDEDDLEELGSKCGDTYVYEEKLDKRNSELMPLTSRTSDGSDIVFDTSVTMTSNMFPESIEEFGAFN